jgi:hypothetical protein
MSLDSYVVKPVAKKTYKVLRYKVRELLDSRVVTEPCDNPRGKREKIVQEYLAQGKPDIAVYWIENGIVQSSILVAPE